MKAENTRIFKYSSKLQESIHRFMIKISKESITSKNFTENEKLVEAFSTYVNFEYIVNIWLWDTFFKYNEQELRYIYSGREPYVKKDDVIGWFIFSMTVSPKAKEEVKVEKEKPKEEVKKAVSFEELFTEEPAEKGPETRAEVIVEETKTEE